ncbi:MAG: amidase [Pseudorhodoplanes sp.]|uniref:amidase n=1 Tax=Pseudorhodoplanes sp. TaxID=1934341 RepID=UPI003D10BC00
MRPPRAPSLDGRDELSFVPAIDLLRLIRSKAVSPVEIAARALREAESTQSTLNAFVTLTPEIAMDAARRAERAVMAGEDHGLLSGLPLSVKDLTAVKDVRFTSGSRTLADFVAPVDSPAAERVKAQGAVIIGKTTTTEFGCKGSSDSPLTGQTRNPWNLGKTTGGSSAGAGASVAAGITPFALGTDGGGSIRIPSSLCGLFGIKAHFGRVPVFPVAATPTLAHVGPMARTVRDAALLLAAISGFDARDPASVAADVPDYLAACETPPKGLRIAWSPTLGYARPNPEVASLAEKGACVFEDMGCSVEPVEKVFDDPIDLWMAEFYAGVGTRLKKTLIEQRELIDPAVANVLDNALDQTIDEYYGRVFARYEFREKVRRFFERFDLLLTPTTPVAAFDIGRDVPPELDGANIVSWVAYTYPFNLCGLPAASIPCGFTAAGLPVGLHVVGRALGETTIFSAAAAFEMARPWADRRPPQTDARTG